MLVMRTSYAPPVSIESHADLEGLRRVGRVVALTLEETRRCVKPGVTTAELDAVAAAVLARHGARSAPDTRVRLSRRNLHQRG